MVGCMFLNKCHRMICFKRKEKNEERMLVFKAVLAKQIFSFKKFIVSTFHCYGSPMI